MKMNTKINIGLIGFGSVGSGFYHCLQEISSTTFQIKKIAVKNRNKKRKIPRHFFTYNTDEVIQDPNIQLIIEVIDDAEAAYQLVKKALNNRKSVVTANKKMLAARLPELIELSKKQQVSLFYEGAVAGSIPIIQTLENFYTLDKIQSISAIVNGTCNFILTKLHEGGTSFEQILAEAQKEGFAESNPTLDIDGWDATYKLQILIYHAFGVWVKTEQINRFGIRNIRKNDIVFAQEQNKVIKPTIHAEIIEGNTTAYSIPKLVSKDDFLHDVAFEFNGAEIHASFANKQLYVGRGAGSIPTASAVLADAKDALSRRCYKLNKTSNSLLPAFTNHKTLKIYASSSCPEKLRSIPWLLIEEEKHGNFGKFIVGEVNLENLLESNINQQEVFVMVVA